MDINIINDNNKEALDNRLVDYHSFAFREQYKIVWRLFKTYKSPLVYNRFKALFYAHSKPNNKDEEEFVNICNLYTKLLNKEISVDDYIKNYSDKKFDFEFEGDVISFLNKCFKELLKVYDGKYFYVFLTLNGILNNLGIVLGTYGESESGENEYLANNTHRLITKTTDSLGRYSINTYVHLPTSYNATYQGNYRIKSTTTYADGYKTIKSREYDSSTWKVNNEVGSEGVITYYEYDNAGNIKTVQYSDKKIKYDYTDDGTISKYNFIKTDAQTSWYTNNIQYSKNSVEKYYSTYSENSAVKNTGNTTQFNYDNKGRITSARTESGFLLTNISYNSSTGLITALILSSLPGTKLIAAAMACVLIATDIFN